MDIEKLRRDLEATLEAIKIWQEVVSIGGEWKPQWAHEKYKAGCPYCSLYNNEALAIDCTPCPMYHDGKNCLSSGEPFKKWQIERTYSDSVSLAQTVLNQLYEISIELSKKLLDAKEKEEPRWVDVTDELTVEITNADEFGIYITLSHEGHWAVELGEGAGTRCYCNEYRVVPTYQRGDDSVQWFKVEKLVIE